MQRVLIGAALVLPVAASVAADEAQAPVFDCAALHAYTSCAIGVGTLAGRIVAAVAVRMAAIIEQVAVDEADREEGIAMIWLSGEETLRRRQASAHPEPCDSVAQTLDGTARGLGIP